jgi:hypothetical protein
MTSVGNDTIVIDSCCLRASHMIQRTQRMNAPHSRSAAGSRDRDVSKLVQAARWTGTRPNCLGLRCGRVNR